MDAVTPGKIPVSIVHLANKEIQILNMLLDSPTPENLVSTMFTAFCQNP